MIVGLPMEPLAISSFSLIDKRKGIVGSAIGSIAETQEMIDYCNEKNIYPEVEMIPMSKINEGMSPPAACAGAVIPTSETRLTVRMLIHDLFIRILY